MIQAFINQIKNTDQCLHLTGVQGSEKAFLTARLFGETKKSIVVILPGQKDAQRFLEDLEFFLPEGSGIPLYFPGYNILPFKSLSYHG